MKEKATKKKVDQESDDMRPEYDFSGGVRGKYASLAGDVHLVNLEADVYAAFPDSKSVNEALRLLIKVAKNAEEKARA